MIHDWSSINVVCVLPDVLKWLMKYHCMKVFAMFYNDGMSLNEIVLWYITMVRYPWKYFVISWNEIVLWYFYSKMFLKLVIDSTITKSCISFTIFTRLVAASDKVYQLLAHGRWFSMSTPTSSTTKTGRHDIAEILFKVALNTIDQSIDQKCCNYVWLKIRW
jgi:hypothetical protein